MLRKSGTTEDDDEDDAESEGEAGDEVAGSDIVSAMRQTSDGGTEYDRVIPLKEDELRQLQREIEQQTQQEEEEHREQEKLEEIRVAEEKKLEEELRNREQPGGPNPRVDASAGFVTCDRLAGPL